MRVQFGSNRGFQLNSPFMQAFMWMSNKCTPGLFTVLENIEFMLSFLESEFLTEQYCAHDEGKNTLFEHNALCAGLWLFFFN